MIELKPAAWLHCDRPDADVITDKIKHIWNGAVVGYLSYYTIPLYKMPPDCVALQKRIAALEKKWVEAIGWAYADCCTTLDAGGDPRQTEMSDVLRRATIDIGGGE